MVDANAIEITMIGAAIDAGVMMWPNHPATPIDAMLATPKIESTEMVPFRDLKKIATMIAATRSATGTNRRASTCEASLKVVISMTLPVKWTCKWG